MPRSVRQLLDDAEADILMRMDPVRKELSILEHELADVRRAKNALHSGPGPVMRLPSTGEISRPAPRSYSGAETVRVEASPSPYAKLTMKQLIHKALEERFTNGATANELLDYFRLAWGRNDIVRTSLSPQLSRLKREGVVFLRGMKWHLVGLEQANHNENGAPATLPLDAPETERGATLSNHQPRTNPRLGR